MVRVRVRLCMRSVNRFMASFFTIRDPYPRRETLTDIDYEPSNESRTQFAELFEVKGADARVQLPAMVI